MIRPFALVTLCAALAAQDKVSPNRFVPKDAMLIARCAAPARWQQQFAGTRAAKLLDSAAVAPLVAQARAAFDAGLARAKAEGKLAPELLDGLIADYAGEATLVLRLDADDLAAAIAEERRPAMSGLVTLSPDGKYDLGALAEGLARLAESERGQALRDLTVGDHRLRFVDQDVDVAVPAMIDGHLVLLFATDLAQAAPHLLAAGERFEGELASAPLFVHAELSGAIAGAFAAARAQLAEQAAAMPFDPIDLIAKATGFGGLDSLDLALTAAGEHAQVEFTMRMKDGEHGLFDMMLVDQGAPKLLRFVPPAAESFAVTPLDLGALYRTVAATWKSIEGELPMSFADAEAAFAEATKVRLKEDLVDHLGTEMLSLTDTGAQFAAIADSTAAGEEPDPTAVFSGYCLGFALRDGKAFGESLEKAVRSRGLHAARKTEEYQGVKIHRLRLAAVFEIEYAVTDELLLLATGASEAARLQLRGALDARASSATALPEALQKRLQDLPAGWNGAGITSLTAMLRGLHTMFTKVAEHDPPPDEVAAVFAVLGAITGDLDRLGLGEMASAMWSTKKGVRTLVRW